MKKIEKLLPFALEAAQKFITIDEGKLSVPKQFKGYISSFGASVIQSGLLPTLAFYSDAKKAKGDRSLLVPALFDILFQNESYPIDIEVQKTLDILDKDKEKDMKPIVHHFFDWLLKSNRDNPEKLRKELLDASIALKLALRTFREVDNDKKEEIMTTPNLGWYFYRDFYNDQREEKVTVDGKPKGFIFSFNYLKYANTDEGKEQKKPILKDNTAVLKERSHSMFDKKLVDYKPETFFKFEATTSSFELTTTYPGLLSGVGYNHGISSESDFKVGFFFDHTTGLPVIPGSSVKGVLRCAFPGYIRIDEDKKPSKEEMKKRYDFFEWLIEQTNLKISDPQEKLTGFTNNHQKIDELEAFIFEGQENTGEQISYYQRDRFFDAYPVKSLGHDGIFLKNDYITPHINRDKPEMSPFTSPNPIQFLKVLPKVKFRFQFKLVKGGGLDAVQKELLFKEILCYMGVGAKTNVGYGQFEEGFLDQPKMIQKTELKNFSGKVRNGISSIEAKVIDQKTKKVLMKINNQDVQATMSGNCPTTGILVNVTISQINKKGEILSVRYDGDLNR